MGAEEIEISENIEKTATAVGSEVDFSKQPHEWHVKTRKKLLRKLDWHLLPLISKYGEPSIKSVANSVSSHVSSQCTGPLESKSGTSWNT